MDDRPKKRSRHMKRRGGYVWPESGKPWWVTGADFGKIFDSQARGFASKFLVVVLLALVWAILIAIFS